jgi:hypothetical protein
MLQETYFGGAHRLRLALCVILHREHRPNAQSAIRQMRSVDSPDARNRTVKSCIGVRPQPASAKSPDARSNRFKTKPFPPP